MAGADFQRRAGEEGRLFQDVAGRLLQGLGFLPVAKNRKQAATGVTINYVCHDARGQEWYFDVSGAATSDRAGLRRTDTVFKTLGRANVLSATGTAPVVVLTTNLPEHGSVGDRCLRVAHETVFDVAVMTDVASKVRLRRYAELGWPTPPLPGFWAGQDIYRKDVKKGGPAGALQSIPTAAFGDVFNGLTVDRLPHRLKVIIPSTAQGGLPLQKVQRDAAINDIKTLLSNVCGGCTSNTAVGAWVDPFDDLVSEAVECVESYMPEPLAEEHLAQVVEIVLKDLDQHTAAVILDGQMLQFSR